jgi:hypothetical protein
VFERSKELLLQAGAHEPVGFGLGMCHRRVLDLDAGLFGEVLKLARGEIRAVVRDDAVRHSVPVDDGLKELDRHSDLLVGDGDCFDPLGELVDGDQKISMASSR